MYKYKCLYITKPWFLLIALIVIVKKYKLIWEQETKKLLRFLNSLKLFQ